MTHTAYTKRNMYLGVFVIIAAALLLEMTATVYYWYMHRLLAKELEHKAEMELTLKAVVTKSTLNLYQLSYTGDYILFSPFSI